MRWQRCLDACLSSFLLFEKSRVAAVVPVQYVYLYVHLSQKVAVDSTVLYPINIMQAALWMNQVIYCTSDETGLDSRPRLKAVLPVSLNSTLGG